MGQVLKVGGEAIQGLVVVLHLLDLTVFPVGVFCVARLLSLECLGPTVHLACQVLVEVVERLLALYP